MADAAGMGRMEIEIMRRGGYPHAFSAVVTATSATIGPIIPPSIPLVVYGSIAGVSVGKLFLAGFLPGLTMALFLMIAIHVIAGRNAFPRDAWAGWGALARNVFRSIPVLMLPVVILGGIFSGVFTATEAAIVASVYAMGIGMVLGELRIAGDPRHPCQGGGRHGARHVHRRRCVALQLDPGARGLAGAISAWFLALGTEPWTFLLLVNVLLLVLGSFMEPLPMMVIVVPTLLPVVNSLGHRSRPFRPHRDAQSHDRAGYASGRPRHVRGHAYHQV